MPKQRITKEIVVETAFQLARQGGMEQVLVKNIAANLSCSVQPIYCYCQNMEGLKQEVISYTSDYIQKYIKERIDPEDLFKSTGLAHASLAKEEPQLYRLYFLRKRDHVHNIDDILNAESSSDILSSICSTAGISPEQATALRRHMMIYNIGLSVILSSLGPDTDMDGVKELLNQVYTIFTTHEKENVQ